MRCRCRGHEANTLPSRLKVIFAVHQVCQHTNIIRCAVGRWQVASGHMKGTGYTKGPILPRTFFGARFKPELLFLSYAAFFGAREAVVGPHRSGGALVALLCLEAIFALNALPGPFKPSGAQMAVNLLGGAFFALLWLPLWDRWVGGIIGVVLAIATAWSIAGLAGHWHDRRTGPIALALRLGSHIEASQGEPEIGQALRIHRGRWWSAAHADLPLRLPLANGMVMCLLAGDRYIWRTSDRLRSPDVQAARIGISPRSG